MLHATLITVLLCPSRRLLAAAGAAILLAACGGGEPGLPSGDVLNHAARAVGELESALFTMDASFALGENNTVINGTLHAEGRLQNAGQQWDLAFRAATQGADVEAFDITGDVIVIGEDEVYLRLQNISGNAAALPLPVDSTMLQKWLKLPAKESSPSMDITPDPKFLAMQAEVVSVVRDRGIVRSGDRRVYHYDIAIDPEKLIHFFTEVAKQRGEEFSVSDIQTLFQDTELTGQIWIDADTFQLQSISWTASPRTPAGYNGTFTFSLRDHNKAPPVIPPERAQPLESVLASPENMVPFLDSANMSPDEVERIQKMLQ